MSSNLFEGLDGSTIDLCNKIFRVFVQEQTLPDGRVIRSLAPRSLKEISNSLDSIAAVSFLSAIEILEKKELIFRYPHRDLDGLYRYSTNNEAQNYIRGHLYGDNF